MDQYLIRYSPLRKPLIDRWEKKDMPAFTGLSENVIVKTGRGGSVTPAAPEKVCFALHCRLSDIVELDFRKA